MERKLPDDELLYFAGTEELTEKVQARFIGYFLDSPGKILEVGCGKGVMLSMLKEKGIHAYGIDLSETAVRYRLQKGLKAIYCDLLSHLRSLDNCSLERFWLDVTHVRLRTGILLRELVRREGFQSVQMFSDKEPARNIFERIIKTVVHYWFLGYMFVGDLILVAER